MCNSNLHGTISLFSFYNYWCVFISTFPSLVVFSIGITSSTIRLQMCAIIAGVKKHKSKIK